MTQRKIVLPGALARCMEARAVPCSLHHRCALALVDGAGRALKDYSTSQRTVFGDCIHFMPVDQWRAAPAAPAPRVHEAPKGLA